MIIDVYEKQIEREILGCMNLDPDGFFWKNPSVGIYDKNKKTYIKSPNKHVISGVSDIIGIWRGHVFFIEVKTAKGKLSDDQKYFIEKINKLGGNAFVARSVEDVFDYLKEFQKKVSK